MVSNCTLRIVLDGTTFVIRLGSGLSTSAVDHTNQASKTDMYWKAMQSCWGTQNDCED